MLLLAHAWRYALFPLKFTIQFIWILSYIVRRSISYAFVLNIMQKHMLYVQSFTLIKSTGAKISLTGAGGIPIPIVQNIHSLCLWYTCISENSIRNCTTYTTLRLLDLTDCNELRCISIILLWISTLCLRIEMYSIDFFFLHTALFVWRVVQKLARLLGDPEEIKK
jgi:hypothetical protein